MHELPYPPNPRKAGYSAHSVTAAEPPGSTALQVHNLSRTQVDTTMGVRLRTTTGLHESRVGSSMPLEGALNPQARGSFRTSLQHPPQTGRKKQAPETSQLCPLKDF